MFGVYSAFFLEKLREEGKKKKLTKKILDSVLLDLNSNLKQLEEKLQDNTSKQFPIFILSSWRNWQNRIELNDIYLQANISNLFNYLEDVNDIYKNASSHSREVIFANTKQDLSWIKQHIIIIIKNIEDYVKEFNKNE